MDFSKQATWGGRFDEPPAELMLRFSESVSFDQRLAAFDIQCSQAYAAMLKHIGILNDLEHESIHQGLAAIGEEIESCQFTWKLELEDVHMNIEHALSKRTDAAAKLHTGRSRNDQVATDMRLYFKSICSSIRDCLKGVIATLTERAEAQAEIAIPGYTHFQRAQPVGIAHHWLAYVEMFARDYERFQAVWQRANICPLGSGALAGSTLPIDREFLARTLGFIDEKGNPRLTQNSMDAVADRDVFIEFASASALCSLHYSRLAEDLIVWSSVEFGFVSLPEAFTTGSSLMPQKKNPDALELIRGKASRVQGNLHTLLTLVKGLPLTYNRDLQEDKPPVFDSADQTILCLEVLKATLAGVETRPERCRAAVADPALLATDLVDLLVERGVAFRAAHHCVGALVGRAEKLGVGLDQLPQEEAIAIEPLLGDDWKTVFDVRRALEKRTQAGMPSPQNIKKQIQGWKNWLKGSSEH